VSRSSSHVGKLAIETWSGRQPSCHALASPMHGTDGDGISTTATHVQPRAEPAGGVLQVGSAIGKVQMLAAAGAYPLGGRNLAVEVLELTKRVEAAVIAVDVEHDHARGLARRKRGIGVRRVRPPGADDDAGCGGLLDPARHELGDGMLGGTVAVETPTGAPTIR
jgi:hypothetical protein